MDTKANQVRTVRVSSIRRDLVVHRAWYTIPVMFISAMTGMLLLDRSLAYTATSYYADGVETFLSLCLAMILLLKARMGTLIEERSMSPSKKISKALYIFFMAPMFIALYRYYAGMHGFSMTAFNALSCIVSITGLGVLYDLIELPNPMIKIVFTHHVEEIPIFPSDSMGAVKQ